MNVKNMVCSPIGDYTYTCMKTGMGELKSAQGLPRHKRSKSFPDKKEEENDCKSSAKNCHILKLNMGGTEAWNNTNNKHSSTQTPQSSLKKEIFHLEKRLEDQVSVRKALEKALGYKSASYSVSTEKAMPKPTNELINEIAALELEVMHLEQYLLSLYRKAFDHQLTSPSTLDKRRSTPSIEGTRPGSRFIMKKEFLLRSSIIQVPKNLPVSIEKERENQKAIGGANSRSVQRSQSSLSPRSVWPTKTSPPVEKLDNALRSCHSQPLSFLQYIRKERTNMPSLAEHFGTCVSDHVPETPNRLSENVIRSMASIYCKLSEHSAHNGTYTSPTSSLSSSSAFSPQDHQDLWSPRIKKLSSFGSWLRSFQDDRSREFSRPLSSFLEVPEMCLDTQRLHEVQDMLQTFKVLVQRLEKVDPREMKHEEKLAFWINVHNALVMHAYIVYGISHNSTKRGSLFNKAAYNVGGKILSADTIQASILGCRTNRPGQWLRTIFSPKMKFRGDGWQSYAIEYPEPLLHFALCTGSHSDPAARVYTAKRVLQELEVAKEEYIREAVSVQKDHKLCLPKVMECYAKDSGLSPAGVVDMVQHHLPVGLRRATQKRQKEKPRRSVEWVPHNHSFRYLLSRELVK